ncbi:MAG: guanylate kinase [Chromatiales bacterium]|nr:guanylate kinase [Chromatiales bacterium]
MSAAKNHQDSAGVGKLFVVSAPSGAGKTSLVRALLVAEPGISASVSYTTRAPRSGEVDGRDYHFVDSGRFLAMVAAGEFLEHAQVFDHHYGTSGAALLAQLDAGRDVVLEIDWQGARQIRKLAPYAVLIFILPPSLQVLRERLYARGQDQPAVIERRMRDALSEISHCTEYDYVIVNSDFAEALKDMQAIVRSQHLRASAQIHRHAELLGALRRSGEAS